MVVGVGLFAIDSGPVGFFCWEAAEDGFELNCRFWLDGVLLFVVRVVLCLPCSLSYSLAFEVAMLPEVLAAPALLILY